MSELSRFNANLGEVHWESAMRVLGYMKGTTGVGLLFKAGESTDLWGYSDASHATCPNAGKGRTRYVFISARVAVSWRSKRVGNASLSRGETEYMGLEMAPQEASFVSQLKGEMDGVMEEKERKSVIFTDS